MGWNAGRDRETGRSDTNGTCSKLPPMSTGQMPLPVGVDTTYPPAPWQMRGQLWLSLFRVRDGDHPDREPGLYGVALVKYEDPSPLTYAELLVAHLVSTGGTPAKAVNITDIWVDSPASVAGGRAPVGDPEGPVRLHLRQRAACAHHQDEVDGDAGGSADRVRAVQRRLPGRASAAVQGRHLAAARETVKRSPRR